ncbi:Detected protein of confused Function [Hibiscus syriacus]|uniref:Detected protein of confused Function n=1 Tax=Hibiscus syriacus TaxID=106335 RepID=A0A6A3B8N8_HIBSY|nr:Detected protein of confused Function [Hibiscus syriacus]
MVTISKSSPNCSSGRTIALPAGTSWGTCVLNQPQAVGLACSNGPPKQNPDTVGSSLPFSSAITNTSNNAGLDCQTTTLMKPTSPNGVTASISLSSQFSLILASNHDDQGTNIPAAITNSSLGHGGQTSISCGEEVGSISSADGNTERLCSDMSTLTLDRMNGHSDEVRLNSSASEHGSSSSLSGQGYDNAVENISSEVEEDILSFDNQRLKDPEIIAHDTSCLHGANVSSLSNGYLDKYISSGIGSDITTECYPLLSNEEKGNQLGRYLVNAESNAANDTGEQHNFKHIEGTKYRPADVESSFSGFGQMPQNRPSSQDFADSRVTYLGKFGVHNDLPSCNLEESDRFSSSPVFPISFLFSGICSYNLQSCNLSHNVFSSRAQISAPPGFSVPSRAPPPGFSSIERVNHAFDPTSGNHLMDCSSLLRNSNQAPQSGGIGGPGDVELIDPAILEVGKGRIQGGLNYPGLDMRSNFVQRLGPYENEARFQLLMQRSLSSHQTLRYDVGDSFSSLNDSYGISSRLMDHSQVNNMSPFAQLNHQQSRNTHTVSNGHWNGWNEVQGGNGLGVAELLRNERLGFNKFYSGYEDSKYRMPTSGICTTEHLGCDCSLEPSWLLNCQYCFMLRGGMTFAQSCVWKPSQAENAVKALVVDFGKKYSRRLEAKMVTVTN